MKPPLPLWIRTPLILTTLPGHTHAVPTGSTVANMSTILLPFITASCVWIHEMYIFGVMFYRNAITFHRLPHLNFILLCLRRCCSDTGAGGPDGVHLPLRPAPPPPPALPPPPWVVWVARSYLGSSPPPGLSTPPNIQNVTGWGCRGLVRPHSQLCLMSPRTGRGARSPTPRGGLCWACPWSHCLPVLGVGL